MKKGILPILVLAVIGLSLYLAACIKPSQDIRLLRIGTSADNRPFEYFNNGEIIGFDIDLIQAICNTLDRPFDIIDMDFDALLPSLQQGKIDMAIAAITPTPEREKHVSFSDNYLINNAALITLKSKPIRDLASLHGKILAVQMGSSYESNVRSLNLDDLTIRTYSQIPKMLQDLQQSPNAPQPSIDGVFIGLIEAQNICKHDSSLAYIKLNIGDNCAIAFPKNSNLVKPVNQIIKDLKCDGIINILQQKWNINTDQ